MAIADGQGLQPRLKHEGLRSIYSAAAAPIMARAARNVRHEERASMMYSVCTIPGNDIVHGVLSVHRFGGVTVYCGESAER